MNFFKTYFTDTQVLFLMISFSSLLIGSIFHVLKKNILSLLFLMVSAITCFSFAAMLDPFLNTWDERFHALVAKNMMNDMLKPMLYANPILDVGWTNWNNDSIWLHKQPLFLWQIAICFKLFGVSEFTLRLPDIILGTLMVYTNYRCGKILGNRDVGFISGSFTIFSLYFVELISGRQMTDHNDFIFLCYVSFSLWAFIEYKNSGKSHWIFIIGAFAACAVLNKWLVGLFVYLVWGINSLSLKKYSINKNLDFLKSLGVTLFLVLPWQLFIFNKYPEVAEREFAYNSKHLSEVVEGHGGSIWYHIEQFMPIYGVISTFILLPGLYFLYKASHQKKVLLSMFFGVAFVYVFFSLVATKMPSFTILVATVFILGLAKFTAVLLNRLGKAKLFLFPIAIVLFCIISLDVEALQFRHTLWKKHNTYSSFLIKNKTYFSELNLPKNAVLFNTNNYYVDAMFYTGLTAYWFLPTADQCEYLKEKNKTIVILYSDQNNLPEHIYNDKEIIKVNAKIN